MKEDGNVIGGQRRRSVVFARGYTGELPELPVEMGLVTVARGQGYVDPGGGLLCGSQFDDALKPEYPTVELWS